MHNYDKSSWSFFRDLGLRQPDEYLGVGSGSQAGQTAACMVGLGKALWRVFCRAPHRRTMGLGAGITVCADNTLSGISGRTVIPV